MIVLSSNSIPDDKRYCLICVASESCMLKGFVHCIIKDCDKDMFDNCPGFDSPRRVSKEDIERVRKFERLSCRFNQSSQIEAKEEKGRL